MALNLATLIPRAWWGLLPKRAMPSRSLGLSSARSLSRTWSASIRRVCQTALENREYPVDVINRVVEMGGDTNAPPPLGDIDPSARQTTHRLSRRAPSGFDYRHGR